MLHTNTKSYALSTLKQDGTAETVPLSLLSFINVSEGKNKTKASTHVLKIK